MVNEAANFTLNLKQILVREIERGGRFWIDWFTDLVHIIRNYICWRRVTILIELDKVWPLKQKHTTNALPKQKVFIDGNNDDGCSIFCILCILIPKNYDNNSYKFCGDHKVHCNYTIYQKNIRLHITISLSFNSYKLHWFPDLFALLNYSCKHKIYIVTIWSTSKVKFDQHYVLFHRWVVTTFCKTDFTSCTRIWFYII